MKNESLMFSLKVFSDTCQERGGKIAIASEIGAIFEIDGGNFGFGGGSFGFLVEINEALVSFSKVIIGDIRSSSAFDAGNSETGSNEASKAER